MNPVIYEVTYANQVRTVTTDMQEIVCFVKDTYHTATVNCWFDGNCIATMEINSENKRKEK